MAKGTLTVRIIGDAKSFSGALDSASDKLGSFAGGATKLVAAGLAAAGVAAGAAFTAGFIQSVDQGATLDTTAAAFALDPAEQAAAGDIAGRLYADAYGDSFGEVSDAVAAVQDQLTDGLGDPAAVEALTAKALDFANVFDTDVAGSVQNAQNLITSGLAKDGDAAFDLLVAGTQNASAAIRGELGEAVNEYSQFFGQLGIDGAEAFDLLGDASNSFEVDKIGDALKELTIRATDMSTASVEAYETAGLSAEDMAAKFAAGGDDARGALQQTVDALLAIEDPVERANASIGLFGTPLEDLGTSEIPQFLGSLSNLGDGLGDVEGAAAQLGDTANDNLATKLEALKRGALQRLTDFITANVVPVVEGAADAFSEDGLGGVVTYLSGVITEAGPQIAAALQQWAGQFVAWAVDAIPPMLAQLHAGLLQLGQWLIDTALPQLSTWMAQWGAAFVAWVDESLPGLIAQLMVLRAQLLAWITTTALPALVDRLSQFAQAFVEWVGPAIAELLPELGTYLGVTVRWLLNDALPRVIVALGRLTWAFLDWIVTGVIPELPGILWGLLQGILNFLREAVGPIDGQLGEWRETFIAWVRDLPERIANAASGMFDGFRDAFRSAINWIIQRWNNLSFSLPAVNIPGLGSVGGFTLSTPNIPLLAAGGDVLNPGLAIVGEAGPELLELPAGARVAPLSGGRGGSGGAGYHAHFHGITDTREVMRIAMDEFAWAAATA